MGGGAYDATRPVNDASVDDIQTDVSLQEPNEIPVSIVHGDPLVRKRYRFLQR